MNNIKRILKEKNISIKKMARDVGLDYSLAHDLVNRENLSYTRVGTLKKVADYLDVSIDELFS